MSYSADEFSARISSILERLNLQKSSIGVFVVSCVKGVTEPKDDFGLQSVVTEFFSSEEIEQILGSLRNCGLYVRPFFSEMDFIRFADSDKFDAGGRSRILVYNTAHSGTGPGRKALLPCFCALHKIPITSSDAYVVSLARHKFHIAHLLARFGLQTPDSWLYTSEHGWLHGRQPTMGSKVILKPTYESASIGIRRNSVITVGSDLDFHVEKIAAEFRQPITVQAFIPGWEVEVPVINAGRPFAPMAIGISKGGENFLGNEILTYDDVNVDSYGFWKFQENDAIVNTLKSSAIRASEILGMRGFTRIDFRVSAEGSAYITDVSTSPHITQHSSYAFLFETLGRPVDELPKILVGIACENEHWI
ncbi:MAG TPA: hypothetical protein VG938_07975 [Verrucomicrobiae bacterium]|jgi:D-alanine-D-alanine ligase|nr:hypothetical protein [Verrucomicrobiae bacterium]